MNRNLLKQRPLRMLAILAVAGIIGATNPQSWAVPVTAGDVSGIGGDYAYGAAPITLYNGTPDSVIQMVLNLGSVKRVDAIWNINPLYNSNSSAKRANIFVALDETAGGFNPGLASSFTVPVFSGLFTPSANTAGTVQMANIIDSQRRYFLIDYTENFWAGSISGAVVGNTDRVLISDLQVLEIPEPSVIALLSLGGLLLRRRQRRNQ